MSASAYGLNCILKRYGLFIQNGQARMKHGIEKCHVFIFDIKRIVLNNV